MMVFRCPKCRSGSITIHELFTVAESIFVEDGKVIGSLGMQGGESQNRFDGYCHKCAHRWRARYETGQAAIEAASALERDRPFQ